MAREELQMNREHSTVTGERTMHTTYGRHRALAATASVVLATLGIWMSPAAAVAAPSAVTGRSAVTAAGARVTAGPATAPGSPVGPLSPSGCTRTADSATCDLYAAAGTTAINSVQVPVWSFTSDGAAPTNPVGPTIVVNQGDTVHLKVHNQLPAAAGNLAVAVHGMPGVETDLDGVPAGGVASYDFSAVRAGTYLYDAGHTPRGSRQAQMGLVGALVVLDSTANTAYGRAYDDEVVLVLSEVDPAFAANPISYDVRNYAPKYRLINGKSFPETEPIGTSQGRKLLLRYVNGGSYSHFMALLNAEQTPLAEDAHALPNTGPEITLTVTPGQSVDSIIAIPGTASSPEAKYTLFEDAQHLDNAGANVAGSTILGFGGMMTYIDTNLPPVLGDQVGPAVKRVAFSQNPATGGTTTVTADATDAKSGGSAIDRIEYVIDDPSTAVCSGTPLTSPSLPAPGAACNPSTHGTQVSVTGASAVIDVDALNAGKHTVFVRALDQAGNWGVASSAVLNVAKAGPATTGVSASPNPTNGGSIAIEARGDDRASGGNVDQAEYIIDANPANLPPAGSGGWTAMTLNQVAPVVAETATIDASALAEGDHRVLVRSHDSLGVWGPVQTTTIPPVPQDPYAVLVLHIDKTGPNALISTIDPTPTDGTAGSAADPTRIVVTATITDAPSNGVNSGISDAEGFIDVAGAAGTGFALAPTTGQFDSRTTVDASGSFPLNTLSGLPDGAHSILVRGKDAAGNWGPVGSSPLVLDRTPPVVSALTATQQAGALRAVVLTANVTDIGTGILAVEWFTGNDPGAGKGTAVTTALPGGTGGLMSIRVDSRGLPPGAKSFSVRARDVAGKWGAAATVSLPSFVQPTQLFTDAFSGALAWPGGSAGQVRTVRAPTGMAGKALAATRGVANGAYLVDTNPAADKAYTATFRFNPGSLTTTAASVTLVSGRSAKGEAFALQYNRNGKGARKFRVVLRTDSGRVVASRWASVPGNTSSVRLVWRNGAAATVSAAFGRVTVSTTGKSFATLESTFFGVLGGARSSGTAFFDNAIESRN